MRGNGGEAASDERSHFGVGSVDPRPDTPERSFARHDGGVRPELDEGRSGRRWWPPPIKWRYASEWISATIGQALATEWERGTAFLFLPVCLSAGALTYFELAWEPSFIPLFSSVAALGFSLFLARRRVALRLMLMAALLVVAGVLAAKIETWHAATKVLGAEISTRIIGRVAVIERQQSGRVRLTIDLVSTTRPRLRYAPDRIRVTARKIPEGMEPGSGVKGVVRLLPPNGPLRPSSYDFSFRSYFDGIGSSGFFLTNPEVAVLSVGPSFRQRIAAHLARLRGELADRVRADIPGPDGEIAAALLTGLKAGIPDRISEALRITGLAHVLSISGLHMALVAGTVILFLRFGFGLFPGFSSHHPVRKYAAGAALATIAFYLVISGAGVATQRSFIMLSVMLVAVMLDRAAITMRNFALAALAVIATAPHEITGPSFQMSFAATAALIGAYAAWGEWRKSGQRRGNPETNSHVRQGAAAAIRHVAGLASTSLIAGTATAIFAAWHFQRVSPLGLVANLATMPIISLAVMPCMVLGLVLMPFGLDGAAFAIMGKGIALFTTIAIALSKHSPFDAIGAIPGAAVIVLTAALVILTLLTTWLRLAALPLIAIGVVLLVRRPAPDVFISEDARLVALKLSDGRVTVNRDRPNAFTMEDWSRAMMASAIVKPGKPRPTAMPSTAPEVPFACTQTLCIAWNRRGMVVAHVKTAATALIACRVADLIVIDDATAHDPCQADGPAVVTKRDLARKGAASVTFKATAKGFSPQIQYSVEQPYRPWHAQRAYSREARGLPPYRRKKHRSRRASE